MIADEVAAFDQDELRHDQRLRCCLEESGAALVIWIRPDRLRDERAGIDYDDRANRWSSPSSSCRSASATLTAPSRPLNMPTNDSERLPAAGTCWRSKSAARSSAE